MSRVKTKNALLNVKAKQQIEIKEQESPKFNIQNFEQLILRNQNLSPDMTFGTLTKTSASGPASSRFDMFISIVNTAVEYYDFQKEAGVNNIKKEMEDDNTKRQKQINKLNQAIEGTQKKIKDIIFNKQRTENDFAILKSISDKEKTNTKSYQQIIEEIKEQIQQKNTQLEQAYAKLSKEKQMSDNIKLATRRILNYETQQDMFDNPPEELKQINAQKDIQQLQNELQAAQQELVNAKLQFQQMEQQLKEKQLQLQVRYHSVNQT